MTPKFKIGQRFTQRGKPGHVYTVTDIFTTYNASGEVVKIRYEATSNVTAYRLLPDEVPETTIAMGALAD